jgi:hypothetical protein
MEDDMMSRFISALAIATLCATGSVGLAQDTGAKDETRPTTRRFAPTRARSMAA